MAEESPIKDPWIVFVRTDEPEKVEREAGMRGTRAAGGVGFVFYDDEKASALARHLTKKGYIVTYGPEEKVAAERAAQERTGVIREESPRARAKLENLAWKKTPQKMRARINQQRVILVEDTYVSLSAMEPAALRAYTHGKPGRRGGAEEAPFVTTDRDPKVVDAGKRWGNMSSPRKIYDALQESMNKESQEVFLVIPLDLHADPLSPPVEIARGQRDRVSVDASDVMRPVITSNCSGFVVAHNHPSGHAKPSGADISLTKNIRAAAKPYAPVTMLDHVVIGRREFYSICEGKLYLVR
jgi:hypothetical protein